MTVDGVTPHVGVWIDTKDLCPIDLHVWSLPTWECGLKLKHCSRLQKVMQSLPTWECGLKHHEEYDNPLLGSHSPRGSVD